MKIPNSNIQAPEKFQTSNSKSLRLKIKSPRNGFDAWRLVILRRPDAGARIF
jgi:hypothetical protein